MLETTKEIIAVVSAAIGALATGIPFLIGFIRKARQLVKERNWSKITEILPSLIIEAEKFLNYTGSEKKEYVKSRLAVYTTENKFAFDEAKFDIAIDDIVKLTKEVNRRDKDKVGTGTATHSVLPITFKN